MMGTYILIPLFCEKKASMAKKIDMLHGSLALNIILYTIPIVLTSWLQLLFNAADLMVVGRFCGSISVAAVGSTGSITGLIVNLFIGLSVGAGVCVAHAIGSREDTEVHRTVHTAIPTAIVSGVILTVIGLLFTEKLLLLMGTPATVLPLASLYMRLFFCGMTFNMVYNFAASILRAAGDTKSPLIILSAAGVLNVILNVFFVTVLNLNVAGVALATALSQAMSAVCVCIVLMKREDGCRLDFRKMRFHEKQLRKIVRIGIPAGIQSCMFSLSNTIIQASVNSFGDVVMSGCAAVSNIEGFCFATVNAFHQSAVNFVGQNTGAGNMKRVRQTLCFCMGYAALFGLFVGVGSYLIAPTLLHLYITDSPEAVQVGIVRMLYTCTPYFIYGIMDSVTGSLRGLGASMTTMILSILGICGVRIAWIYTIFRIPAYHTPESLYISWPISWVVNLIIQAIAFAIVYRKISKKDEANL